MAIRPLEKPSRDAALRLDPFDPRGAPIVASWVRTRREAYWLAPQTAPPITAADVLRWRRPRGCPLELRRAGDDRLLGYGEVNLLNADRRAYWLGHVIVAPDQRGRGLGRRLTHLLLAHAFEVCGARRVSLVVFPENRAAVACYRAAGMIDEGVETHYFEAWGRSERLLRLGASRPPALWRGRGRADQAIP